jgi:hypothetical protein
MDGHPIMKETDIERIVEQLSGKAGDFSIAANDSPEESIRWKQLGGIARMMRNEPAVEAPAGLEERVMARVRAHRISLWKTLGEALLRPRTASFDPIRALRSPVSGEECSFYFIMVGAFYAVLSIALMIGFGELGTTLAAPDWVRWQPLVALITATVLIAVGLYLIRDGRMAARIARIGTLFYLGFVIINGIAIRLDWNIPISVYFAIIAITIGLLTGIFLIGMIHNYGKKYANV